MNREKTSWERGTKIVLTLPPMIAVLVLWGGNPGSQFTLTYATTYPNGDTDSSTGEVYTWPDSPEVIVNITISGKFGFDRSGVYTFKFLANGDPLGTLQLPVFGEGEFPG